MYVFCNLAPNNEYLPIDYGEKEIDTVKQSYDRWGLCWNSRLFGWDITLVRIIYVLATFFTAFSGGLVYLILWLVMPEAGRESN